MLRSFTGHRTKEQWQHYGLEKESRMGVLSGSALISAVAAGQTKL